MKLSHSCEGRRPTQVITSRTDVCFHVSRRKRGRKKCYNNRAGRKREICVCVWVCVLDPNMTREGRKMLRWTLVRLFAMIPLRYILVGRVFSRLDLAGLSF